MNALIDVSNVKLETERLILRPFLASDLEDFYEYARVLGVGENAGWKHHESIEESKKILDFFLENKKTFAVVDKLTHKVIGSLGIESYNEALLPELHAFMGREIGCVLSKDYWGKGLMPEAVAKVMEYLFLEKRLDFIVYSHFISNYQSQRVCEKNNFRFIKEYTRMGIEENVKSRLYLLFYEEWKKNV